MKNVIVLLFMTGFILVSCSEGEFDVLPEKFNEQELISQTEKEYQEFIEEHGSVSIQFVTLEELNDFNRAHGLKELTKFDFTEEEWEYLQNPADYAKPRCDSEVSYIGFIGDMNGNGIFTTFDQYLAQVGVNQNIGIPNTWNVPVQYRRYGQFDHFVEYRAACSPYEPAALVLDQEDICTSQKVLIGVLPCL